MSDADESSLSLPLLKKERDVHFSPSSPSAGIHLMTSLQKIDNVHPSVTAKSFGDVSDFSPGSPENQCCSSTTQDHPCDSNLLHQENIDFSLQKDNDDDDDMPRRLCLVCGDIASGFHYGVASCEACKAFFKRTIQGNIEYTCLIGNDCEINKRRRKSCQACRFQKCLQMGMLKEGVRLDRVRGGRQKYRRNAVPYAALSPQRMNQASDENSLLEILLNCEPELLSVSVSLPDEGSSETTPSILNTLSNLYDKELVNIIGWAKQIPGFTELSLNNQMRLLQSTWTEILTFALSFRSLNSSGKLMFAIDFFLDEVQARECGASELFQLCNSIMKRLRNSMIIKEEFLLLKALVLANSDVLLDEAVTLKQFRDSIITALTDCVTVTRGNSSVTLHLLLILPVIRQADAIVRTFWSTVRQGGQVAMNKLFTEMLDNSL